MNTPSFSPCDYTFNKRLATESPLIGSSILDLVRCPSFTNTNHSNYPKKSKTVERCTWKVHKFGGSSFANPQCYAFVADLISSFSGKNLIVVSAMSGITDLLHEICDHSRSFPNITESLPWLTLKQRVSEVISIRLKNSVFKVEEEQRFHTDLMYLGNVLSHMRTASLQDSHHILSLVVGYGEIWSARLLALIMTEDHKRSSAFMDAREVLVVKPECQDEPLEVCWNMTRRRLKEWFKCNATCDFLIVTGFIARSVGDNLPTTLKRNGSDLSATIFSVLAKAHSVTIWKDVDGMYTADPKKNPDAKFIPCQTFAEAEEAARNGAFVLQPECIAPVRDHNIPIFLRNSFNLACPGTRIGPPTDSWDDGLSGWGDDEEAPFGVFHMSLGSEDFGPSWEPDVHAHCTEETWGISSFRSHTDKLSRDGFQHVGSA